MGYPPRILSSFPICRRRVKVLVPEVATQYLLGEDGSLQMRLPAMHRESQQLVWLEAPTVDCSEATVFRDCPEFEPYRPIVPDCEWTARVQQGCTHTFTGALLCAADD